MWSTVAFVATLLGAVSCLYYPSAWNLPQVQYSPVPRCVLGDQLRYLPMFIVPERQINVIQDYRTKYFPTAPALVTLVGRPQPLPAVKVILSNPIQVSSWKSMIEFPTSFTILQDGYRLPFPVSAVYAPLPERDLFRRPIVNVVYAVPATSAQPPAIVTTTTTPTPSTAFPPRNVTILHFPDALAEPQVIYTADDDELGGRNPPVPVVPAGIVQSAAPTPDFTVFINSKESPVLQLLRDEANKQKEYIRSQSGYY